MKRSEHLRQLRAKETAKSVRDSHREVDRQADITLQLAYAWLRKHAHLLAR